MIPEIHQTIPFTTEPGVRAEGNVKKWNKFKPIANILFW